MGRLYEKSIVLRDGLTVRATTLGGRAGWLMFAGYDGDNRPFRFELDKKMIERLFVLIGELEAEMLLNEHERAATAGWDAAINEAAASER